jgi:hypothetical protein
MLILVSQVIRKQSQNRVQENQYLRILERMRTRVPNVLAFDTFGTRSSLQGNKSPEIKNQQRTTIGDPNNNDVG